MLLVVAGSLAALAIAFAAVASRTVDRAGSAEADAAARRRFAAAFAAERLPADMVIEAYDTLWRRVGTTAGVEGLRPGARLAELGMSAADVEDVALLIAARCEGLLPHARDLDRLDREVDTVGDLVRYVASFSRPQPAAMAA